MVNPSAGIREVAISRAGEPRPVTDLVAVEEPMEVRVKGAPFAVIVRTVRAAHH